VKLIVTTLKVAFSVLLTTAFFAASAQACSYPAGEAVFSPWGDPRAYVLAPDGGFEAGGAGWSLEGGATVVSANETSYLNSASDLQSLALPEGSSATSPTLCVNQETPFVRAMVRSSGKGARLRVETIYPDLGVVRTHTVGGERTEWVPTHPLSTSFGRATVTEADSVQIRLTPVSGDWQVDDLYIDPFARY
jgi:hypothetical protein